METAAAYRKYADVCKDMAREMPLHSGTLQEVARAWAEAASLIEQLETPEPQVTRT